MQDCKLKYSFILAAMFSTWSIVHSQTEYINFQTPDTAKFGIEFTGDWMYQTTGIQNRLIDKFLFGGYIDQETKASSLDNLNHETNFVGARIKNGVRFYLPQLLFLKNDRWGHFGGIYNQNKLTGNITSDLYELALYGNDDEVRAYRIKNTGFEWISSNQLEWGVYDKKMGSTFSVSLHQAYNRLDAELGRKADLFMSEEGSTLLAFGNLQTSNPLQNGISALNGWGLTTDLSWVVETSFFKDQDPVKLNFSIQNLGGFVWSNYSQETVLDTAYEYQGYELINTFQGPSIPENISDTLNINTEEGYQISFAPFILSFKKIIDYNKDKKWQAFYGVTMWSTVWNLPLVHAGVDYKITDGLHTNTHLSIGGFGRLRGGWSISYASGQNFNFWIGTQDIYGLISKNGNGRALNGGIRLWM